MGLAPVRLVPAVNCLDWMTAFRTRYTLDELFKLLSLAVVDMTVLPG